MDQGAPLDDPGCQDSYQMPRHVSNSASPPYPRATVMEADSTYLDLQESLTITINITIPI